MIAALPGMDPGLLNEILVQRAQGGPQNAAGARWHCSAPPSRSATIAGSKAVRVTARIVFDSGQRMTTEAVIFILDSGGEPYRIMTWRDDLDDAPADQRNGRDPMNGLGGIKGFSRAGSTPSRPRSSAC